MIPIEQIIRDNFPETIDVPTGAAGMAALAATKTKLKAALPPDAIVELTLFMNTVELGVYVGKWYRRTATVKPS